MSWIKNGTEYLQKVTTSKLKKAFSSEKNVKAKIRLHAALLRRKGSKIEDIANTLEKPKGTISKWLNKLEKEGLSAATPIKPSGRPRRLTHKQLKTLYNDLLKLPEKLGYQSGFWNTRLVKAHVRKKFKVVFTPRHMTRLLSKIGFSFKKPRAFNPRRATPEELLAFKKRRVEWCWLPNAREEQFL